MFYCTLVLLLLVCLSAVVFLCFFRFFLLLFSKMFPQKVNSYFAELLKWHLLWKLALQSAVIYRKVLYPFIQKQLSTPLLSSLLKASNVFPLGLSFQSSVQDWGEEVEEGAIYNVTLKRVQIQQAANKGARWLGVSRPVWCLTVWQNRSWQSFFKEETSQAPNPQQNKSCMWKLVLFPHS